jgi:GT2 family glycosyltransferase
MSRTAVVMLTWNRIGMLKNTINTFRNYHNLKDEHFIIVDNGSMDGTQKFLKSTKFDFILNKSNLGAQMGKYIGWDRAVEKKYDFIIFIEDDHSCYRTVPIIDLENYLDEHEEIGIIRLNDKPYLKRHQITRLPIINYGKDKLNSGFKVSKFNYHFTSHPSIFRTSLVSMLKGCVFPEYKLIEIDVNKLGFDKNHTNYEMAKERAAKDFGVTEKEYMRLFLLHYRLTAQLIRPCFKWVNTSNKRATAWRN